MRKEKVEQEEWEAERKRGVTIKPETKKGGSSEGRLGGAAILAQCTKAPPPDPVQSTSFNASTIEKRSRQGIRSGPTMTAPKVLEWMISTRQTGGFESTKQMQRLRRNRGTPPSSDFSARGRGGVDLGNVILVRRLQVQIRARWV